MIKSFFMNLLRGIGALILFAGIWIYSHQKKADEEYFTENANHRGSVRIDGYKGILFGTSPSDLFRRNPCRLQKVQTDVVGLTTLGCKNFPVGHRKVEAGFYFFGEKLKRIGIIFSHDDAGELAAEMVKTYGPPWKLPTDRALASLKRKDIQNVDYVWGDNVLVVRVTDDAVTILYSAPDYNELLTAAKDANLSGNL